MVRTRAPQVEDSGDQIAKESAGKRRKKRWILQEHTGSHRIMEAVFRPENFRIFPGDFRPVPGGKHRKVIGNAPEKIQKFFRPEYCFHDPVTSSVFLPELSRTL